MELNHLLLWMVGLSCGLLTLRLARTRSLRRTGWFAVSTGLLVVTACLWVVAPDDAGLIAGALWGVFLMAPLTASMLMRSASLTGAWTRAIWLSRVVALLHPMDGMRGHVGLMRAMRHLDRGEVAQGRALLARLGDVDNPIARSARVVEARAAGDWQGFCDWVEGGPRSVLLADPAVLAGYVRALGELGRVHDVVAAFREHGDDEAIARDRTNHGILLLQVAALTGRLDLVEHLLGGAVARLSPPARALWEGTALQTAGRHDEAAEVLRAGLPDAQALLGRELQGRLDAPLPALPDDALDTDEHAWLDELTERTEHERTFAPVSDGAAKPWVTYVMALALAVAFAFELPGGSTDIENLIDLGALVVPTARTPGEWWRVLTAGFLHYGPVHLAMNLAGLLLLGGWLERSWGRLRMAATYAVCVFASLGLLPLIASPGVDEVQIVVGASGGIMGLLGALLGFLIVGSRQGRNAAVSSQLRMMVMLVVIQVLFDLSTPQVSGTAHLLGLATGVLMGLVVGRQVAASRRRAAVSV